MKAAHIEIVNKPHTRSRTRTHKHAYARTHSQERMTSSGYGNRTHPADHLVTFDPRATVTCPRPRPKSAGGRQGCCLGS